METKPPTSRASRATIHEAHDGGMPSRIPYWIAETHERAAKARAELLRRISALLQAPTPRPGQ